MPGRCAKGKRFDAGRRRARSRFVSEQILKNK